jgi:NADH dehydrogenase
MKFSEVLVVGGSGFIGRHLVAALAARGVRVIVPSRRRERAKHLFLLPTVDVLEADVLAPGVLERLADRCQAVVNLVGTLHSRRGRRDERGPNDYGPDFARVHVELPQAIVNACRATGARRLLHVSALGADANAPSEYLRSKAIGEQAVLAAADLEATAFRPSVVFGPEDRFLNQFALVSRITPALGVPCPDARFQPVYVGDVVRAMLAALDDPEAHGRCFELCGPREYRLKELVELVCRITGRRRLVLGLPSWASYLQARLFELMPEPLKLMTRDNYYSMQVPNVCTMGAPLPFGLVPQAIEAVAPSYLAPAGMKTGPRERYPELRWRARR